MIKTGNGWVSFYGLIYMKVTHQIIAIYNEFLVCCIEVGNGNFFLLVRFKRTKKIVREASKVIFWEFVYSM
jgi:hypothetical protein